MIFPNIKHWYEAKKNSRFSHIVASYHINSKKVTKFRIWTTNVLKEYIIKVLRVKNDLKFGRDYYDELLETIKEIRLSERRLYQKITDLFEATSIVYNKDSEEAYIFFKNSSK